MRGQERIGLIADLHGNAIGLNAVLAELDREGVDEIVCLGDVAVLGPRPAQVIETLRERGIPTVCGNVDIWAGEGALFSADPPTSTFTQTLVSWTRSRLKDDEIHWLGTLPMTVERHIAGHRIGFCHGSPSSVDDIIVNLPPGRVGEFSCDVIVGGHSHQQADEQIGAVRYLNPGSAGLPGVGPGAGLPVHEAPTWVEFAILTVAVDLIDMDMRRVPIDVASLIEDAADGDLPMLDNWRALWGI